MKRTLFKILCLSSGCLLFYLFYLLQFNSNVFLIGLSLNHSSGSMFLAERASVLMLGWGVLSLSAVFIKDRYSGVCISGVLATVWLGLSFMSAKEITCEMVNSSLKPAMITEAVFGVLFLISGIDFIEKVTIKNNY